MGHPNFVAQADGKLQVAPDAYDAPRLSVALLRSSLKNPFDLLQTPLQKEVDGGRDKITMENNFDKDLGDLLQHIQDRLDMGLVEAWLSEHGYGVTADKKQIEDAWNKLSPPSDPRARVDFVKKNQAKLFEFGAFYATPEEAWARAFTEMVVFSAYQNPPLVHYWSKDAKPIFAKYPTWHAIGMACQYLSSYAILSRGFSAGDIGDGCACSGTTTALSCFDQGLSVQSKKLPPPTADKPDPRQETAPGFATTQAIKEKGCLPGSVVAFNPGGPEYTGQDKGPYTHIGTLLRRHGEYSQFIDTGVMVGKGEGAGGEAGTVDHAFANGAIPQAKHVVGLGVLNKEPGSLAAAAQACLDSKSIGFARLAIVDVSKDPGEVRFVSRMVHMKYPPSRFIWSLRRLPVDRLRPIWMLYMPNGADFTDELLKSPTNTPGAIYAAAKASYDPKKQAGLAADKSWVDKHPFGFYVVNIVRGDASGSAVVCRRKSDKKDGYVEDFESPLDSQLPDKPKATMGQGLKLDLAGEPKLSSFATAAATLDQQYVKKPGAKGEVGAGLAGGSFMA